MTQKSSLVILIFMNTLYLMGRCALLITLTSIIHPIQILRAFYLHKIPTIDLRANLTRETVTTRISIPPGSNSDQCVSYDLFFTPYHK